MTQPRRKRRRRRSRGADGGQRASSAAAAETGAAPTEARASRRSRRRRSGRGRPQQSSQAAPAASSEDIVRAPARKPPANLSRPPDGLTLEQIVGELQSELGVPQSPQEFRITLKVAEDRPRAGGATAVVEERSDPEDPEELVDADASSPDTSVATEDSGARVRREKAPAAPRVGAVEGSGEEGEAPRKKRRRSRRRRRGGKAH
jgi:hypothetical protein